MLGAVGQRQRYFYQFYHGVLKINSTSRMQIMFHSQHSRLKSGVEMDWDRRQSAGYEYLCHLQVIQFNGCEQTISKMCALRRRSSGWRSASRRSCPPPRNWRRGSGTGSSWPNLAISWHQQLSHSGCISSFHQELKKHFIHFPLGGSLTLTSHAGAAVGFISSTPTTLSTL